MDQFDHRRRIDDRLRIRRTAKRGDAGGRRGAQFAGNGRLMIEPRFPQTGAEIDQAGNDDQALGVDDPFGLVAPGRTANRRDAAIFDKNIGRRVDAVGRIDDAAALYFDTHHEPA